MNDSRRYTALNGHPSYADVVSVSDSPNVVERALGRLVKDHPVLVTLVAGLATAALAVSGLYMHDGVGAHLSHREVVGWAIAAGVFGSAYVGIALWRDARRR